MCHLVTVAVTPPTIDAAAAFRDRGLTVWSAVNPSVRNSLPAAATMLDVTDGQCSCSISVGTGRGSPSNEAAEISRYMKKGWSRSKAERAVAARQAAHNRSPRNQESARFIDALEEIATAGGRIQVVSHSFSGDFARETVSLGLGQEMSVSMLRERRGVLPEDVPLTIVR